MGLRQTYKNPEFSTPERKFASRVNAVATSSQQATDAAMEMLRQGGSAVDAAVAAGWALSVCEPSGSGLGGQATMLVHPPNGRQICLDGHSHAPANLRLTAMRGPNSRRGRRACTIPSMPAVLADAHKRWGRLPLAQTLEPAIRLAAEGFAVPQMLAKHLAWCRAAILADASLRGIFAPKGQLCRHGQLLQQPALAQTFKRLADDGVDDFYHGETARRTILDMAHGGGFISAEDLATLGSPAVRKPLSAEYRGHTILTAPPPGGGMELLLGLRIMSHRFPSGPTVQNNGWRQTLAAVCQTVFCEREKWPLHPRDLTPATTAWLLSDARAKELAENLDHPVTVAPVGDPGGDTSHICVADADGCVVSLTQSIQSLFGAKTACAGTGIIYNNYLRTCPRYPHPFRLGPGCEPRSNVIPTIVLDPTGTPTMAIGAAGSRRIISATLQVLCGVLDFGQDIVRAVAAPRLHMGLQAPVHVEAPLLTSKLRKRLTRRFGSIFKRSTESHYMGCVQALARRHDDSWRAAADPRRKGVAEVQEDCR